ncbi:TPA: DUF2612 domain-containing protein [Escherichia coli]
MLPNRHFSVSAVRLPLQGFLITWYVSVKSRWLAGNNSDQISLVFCSYVCSSCVFNPGLQFSNTLSRVVSQPISGVYFSWDTDGLGYDQGVWQGPYDPDSGYMYLSDETYRVILKAKIAINNWDGRNDSLPAILDAATAGSGLRMQIVDNQDMTISVWVFPDTDISDVSRELIAAIKQGYLTVKAAGVWAGGIETPSVETPSEGSKFFGFDMDNEFISGFDVGAWGVLL